MHPTCQADSILPVEPLSNFCYLLSTMPVCDIQINEAACPLFVLIHNSCTLPSVCPSSPPSPNTALSCFPSFFPYYVILSPHLLLEWDRKLVVFLVSTPGFYFSFFVMDRYGYEDSHLPVSFDMKCLFKRPVL